MTSPTFIECPILPMHLWQIIDSRQLGVGYLWPKDYENQGMAWITRTSWHLRCGRRRHGRGYEIPSALLEDVSLTIVDAASALVLVRARPIASSAKPAADVNQQPGLRPSVVPCPEAGMRSCHTVLDPLNVLAAFGHHPLRFGTKADKIKWLRQTGNVEQIILF